MDSARDTACAVGFPIRKSSDQRLLPSPRRLSQGATSFIASECQGIHQMPFSHLRARAQGQNPRTGFRQQNLKNSIDLHGVASGASHRHVPINLAPRSIYRPRCPIHDVKERDGWFRHPPEGGDFIPSSDAKRRPPEMVEADGFEPTTYGLQSRRSPN